MKRLAPLTLALSLAYSAAQAGTFSSRRCPLQVGQQLMQSNGLLLRNGDDVWKRIREGYQLTEVDSEAGAATSACTAPSRNTKRTLTRGQRYLFHIMNEVERRGMPTEIALLPLVESAFNPTAVSRRQGRRPVAVHAATGRHYGLEQTFLVRRPPRCAGRHQRRAGLPGNLYAMFGDWNLALASCQLGRRQCQPRWSAIAPRACLETFEAIRMPNETRNYVPKLLAVRNILANPALWPQTGQIRQSPVFRGGEHRQAYGHRRRRQAGRHVAGRIQSPQPGV